MAQYMSQAFPKPSRNVFTLICTTLKTLGIQTDLAEKWRSTLLWFAAILLSGCLLVTLM